MAGQQNLTQHTRAIVGKLKTINGKLDKVIARCKNKPDPLDVPFFPGGFAGTPFAFFKPSYDPRFAPVRYRISPKGTGG